MKKIQAIEVYDLIKISGRWDEPSRESFVGTYPRRYLAERARKESLKNIPESEVWDNVIFSIRPKLVEATEHYLDRPENFIHLEEVEPIKDVCGEIKKLYSSKNVSLSYVNLFGKAKEHMHSVMEEVYFVTKGEGNLTLGEDKYKIEEGDTINIPKGVWHFLESGESKSLELLVVTSPKFFSEDVILRE